MCDFELLGNAHDVVAREFAVLLQNLILVNQHVPAKRRITVLLDQGLHRLRAQLQQLDVGEAAEV